MQLASITFDGEKKIDAFIIPPTYFRKMIIKIYKTKKLLNKVTVIPVNTAAKADKKPESTPVNVEPIKKRHFLSDEPKVSACHYQYSC
jgi:uncharacterized protein YifN (PemK superfamily)